ncbi:MAG: YraN family protein [Clostridia bacterium]|nr:YraN family protein [Clostridia bacterium]
MTTTKTIGDFGEECATKYLKSKGYAILKRNFHSHFGEIDIIARDSDNCLIFVEVKTRKNTLYGNPSEFVDRKKQEKLRKTALFYTHRDDVDMRFDIIEVIYSVIDNKAKVTHINHIENAF